MCAAATLRLVGVTKSWLSSFFSSYYLEGVIKGKMMTVPWAGRSNYPSDEPMRFRMPEFSIHMLNQSWTGSCPEPGSALRG